jgi:hypothetical protein
LIFAGKKILPEIPFLKDFIQLTTIVGHHILDVAHILESALYLEAVDSRLYELPEVATAVHIAQGEQMLLPHKYATIAVEQVHRQTTRLGAFATIGTPTRETSTQIALPADADTECSVYEALYLDVRHSLMYLPYLVNGQFAGDHESCESQLVHKPGPLDGAVVHLSGGVQGHRGKMQAQESVVLHDKRVDTGIVKLPRKTFGFGQLVVAQYGVERYVGLGTILMAEGCKPLDIGYSITRSSPCTEPSRTYIHGICAMSECLYTYLRIARGCQ